MSAKTWVALKHVAPRKKPLIGLKAKPEEKGYEKIHNKMYGLAYRFI